MCRTVLNVLYQSSDYYSIPTGVSMSSLLANNEDLDEINIYLLDDGISEKHLAELHKICNVYKRHLYVIPTDTIREKVVSLGLQSWNGSYATFYKLFAFDEIDAPTDLILYLDGDTIIDKSLRGLVEVEFDDNELIGAVIDLYMKSHKSNIGLDSDKYYFNAGVLLVDHSKWKQEKCLQKVVSHIKERQKNYFVADQDMINVLFGDRIKIISPTYNFNSCFFMYGAERAIRLYDLDSSSYYKTEVINGLLKEGACIYHCLGSMEGRPWEKNNHHPLTDLYDKYLSSTSWANDEKYEANRNSIAKLQWLSFKTLPGAIHFGLHKKILKRYLKKRDL